MKVGTKSVLFGVHCFWWHPITVARAWRDRYGCWPKGLAEWAAVLFHDIGYWGSPNIDGKEGQQHPLRSVEFLFNHFLRPWNVNAYREARALILGHSRHYSERKGFPISVLYAPDKISVLFDPPWFYLLRARLSGELWEFIKASETPYRTWATPEKWLDWYRAKVRKDFDLE